MPTLKPSWIIIEAFFAMIRFPGSAAIAMTDAADAARESTTTRTMSSRCFSALVDRQALEQVPAGAGQVHLDLALDAGQVGYEVLRGDAEEPDLVEDVDLGRAAAAFA